VVGMTVDAARAFGFNLAAKRVRRVEEETLG
jgi:hypothetical protein